MIEALAALAILGLMTALFVPFVTQILGRWTTGLQTTRTDDRTMRSIVRLQAELSRAVALRLPSQSHKDVPLAFAGQADFCKFVRAVEEKSGITLQTVSLTIDDEEAGAALIRRSTAFDPDRFEADPRGLGAPVAVVVGQYRMKFSYVSREGLRTDEWAAITELPAQVDLSIQPRDGGRTMPAPITFVLPTSPAVRRP